MPKSFFGALEPRHHVPRNNILLVGLLAVSGAAILEFYARRLGGGAYEIGAQALNFGALISFMGVNAASLVNYWWREKCRNPLKLASPLLGMVICLFLWLNLSRPAFIVGSVWMTVGILYGAYRTRGFRSQLVTFDVPAEEC